jgi:hypothetical protein
MKGRIVTDTSDFYSIDCGDVICIGEKKYTVLGYERERRFGLEDPKFWVKRVVDSITGERKIIKLSFLESFGCTLGGIKINCFRNPDKEGEILKLVKDHPNFMQGKAFEDSKGNNVRILDVVRGKNFFFHMNAFNLDHKTYFRTILPGILKRLVTAFEAIRFLHVNGFKHGDIRNDHIIVEGATENYVWIDFDYDYETSENPFALDIFGLGNILIYAIGKGFHEIFMINRDRSTYGDLIGRLEPDDFSLLDKRRFINLRKLYAYIPKPLNDILLHFSKGANVYYERVSEIIKDLNICLYSVF